MFKMKEKLFCPKCKSKNVKIKITVSSALGAHQEYVCNNCGYQNYIFPRIKKINKK